MPDEWQLLFDRFRPDNQSVVWKTGLAQEILNVVVRTNRARCEIGSFADKRLVDHERTLLVDEHQQFDSCGEKGQVWMRAVAALACAQPVGIDVVTGIDPQPRYAKLRETFVKLHNQHKPAKILFEESTTGKALKKAIQFPGGFLIKLVEIEPDRKGRVYVVQSMFEEGLVRFPKDAPFMRDLENELLSYPYGQTDDIVDSIALVLTVGGAGYDSSLRWVSNR